MVSLTLHQRHKAKSKRSFMSLQRTLAVVLVTAGLITALASPAMPQRGGKNTDPQPSGTILYDNPVNAGTANWYRETRAVNADGTGSRLAFACRLLDRPVPSARVYGTDAVLHRWWLTIDQVVVEGASREVYELFACRLDADGLLQQVQLTELYPQVTLSPSPLYALVAWSNDGNDSFISFRGRSYGPDTAETPVEERDLADDRMHLFRLNFSGDDIQVAFEAGINPKFGIVDFATGWIDNVLESTDLAEWAIEPPMAYHHWSPDGTRIAYVMAGGLWIANVNPAGTVTHGDPNTWQVWTFCRNPQWSPDGGWIAFGDAGTIRKIKHDGSNATQIVGRTSTDAYGAPVWSPDGRHLAVVHKKTKSSLDPKYYLSRVPSAGGSETILTTDNASGEKQAMRWFAP